jgi:hypothetical protein
MKTIRVATALFLAGVMLAAGQPIHQTEPAFEVQASKLLKEVQYRATALTREAASLDSYARGGLSKTSHSVQLTLVKDHINAIGTSLKMLQEMRDLAAPWQQEAIDSVIPAAADVAAHTEAAILHLNGFSPLWHPDYTAHLRAISDRSNRVKDSIDVHLAMASMADKLEGLRDRASELKENDHV